MTELQFIKIQSTGNDFIVFDYRTVPQALFESSTIQKMCHRQFGIGADGLIALEKSADYAFRFHYYNADGSRATMCGNGLRAAIRFACDNRWIAQDEIFSFLADDGVHHGWVKDHTIKTDILVNDVVSEVTLSDIDAPDWISQAFNINTGVPHLVLICSGSLKDKEIITTGKDLRYHDLFKPQGTNVNFVKILQDDQFYIRTYERGVENETLSCGTGVTASSIVAREKFAFKNEVDIITHGGNLKVTFEDNGVFICGPSVPTFKGTITL